MFSGYEYPNVLEKEVHDYALIEGEYYSRFLPDWISVEKEIYFTSKYDVEFNCGNVKKYEINSHIKKYEDFLGFCYEKASTYHRCQRNGWKSFGRLSSRKRL